MQEDKQNQSYQFKKQQPEKIREVDIENMLIYRLGNSFNQNVQNGFEKERENTCIFKQKKKTPVAMDGTEGRQGDLMGMNHKG